MLRLAFGFVFFLGINWSAAAAEPMPMPMPMPMPASPAPVPTASSVPAPAPMGEHDMAGMTPAGGAMAGMLDPRVPSAQEGSGTSWLPASTEELATMRTARGGATTMEHYAAFARFVDAGSPRGARRFDAPNWYMLMRSRAAGERAQLAFRAMLSLDPLTENRAGYPNLYQTGESAYGAPLHDRQHPHELISELSASYALRTGPNASAYVYAGYPGEPALGPPAYMHRRIAYDMASSPIGHHWQDATHISFGVVTLGAGSGAFKLEASTFSGREPDEIRTNFDPPRLDSASARVSWNPGRYVAAQISYGYVHAPDPREPGVSLHRTTASAFVDVPLGTDRNVWYGVVWGRNQDAVRGAAPSDAWLAEADYRAGRDTLYTRLEHVRKSAGELVIPALAPDARFSVGAYAFGYVHDLAVRRGAARTGLGVELTLQPKPAALDPYYGAGTPASFQIFLRVRPPAMHDAHRTGA